MNRFACLAATCLHFAVGFGIAGAETEESPPPPPSRHHRDVQEIVITASPLGRSISDVAVPASVLQGEALRSELAPTLGETLSTEPGVNSSYFGPGASRPVIRGQDADHIRVLQNGVGTIDASAASPDHAVSLEPINVRRIEIIRGPAALLYGPTGVGGVVNVIDNRIPEEPIERLASGALEGRGDSTSDLGGGAALLEGGIGGFAYHLDGFGRKSDDLRIRGFARSARLRALEPLPDDGAEEEDRLPNSAIETTGGTVGGAYHWGWGYFGVAPSLYNSNYGTVAEKAVTIDLKQRRLDLAGALTQPIRGFRTVRTKLGLSDYEHTELEGTEVGTVFKNEGYDGRLEVLHEPLGPFEGALGFQSARSDFSALGAEAFLPPTLTNTQAGFVFEELDLELVRLQFGGRIDYEDVEVNTAANFGPGSSKSFTNGSAAAGAVYSPFEDWALSFSIGYTERPPIAQELFANGPHVATAAFEVGDRNLDVERSVGVDFSISRTAGPVTGRIGGFYNRFDDYITLVRTGELTEPEPPAEAREREEPLPIFEYRNLAADFVGFEAELMLHAFESDPHHLDVALRADYVRAENRDDDEPLPRISPLRFGGSLLYHGAALDAHLEILRVRRQDRVPAGDLPTDGYTMLNVGVGYPIVVGPVTLDGFVRGNNLLDEEARNAVSFLKDIAPLPGRGVAGGARVTF